MKKKLEKIGKAVDAFTDVLTEDVDAVENRVLFRYQDFENYILSEKKKNDEIKAVAISVQIVSQYEKNIFTEKKYLIRIVLLNEEKEPILFQNNPDEYEGMILLSSSIDEELSEFMKGKTERTVGIK